MNNDWSEDIEKVLDQIRINCVILSKQHKKRYFHLNNILQYFRLPVIIISGINSIISVGLQPYLNQGTISMMTCLLALACSIIGSIELYLAIQKSMENELMASKDFYILSIDLHKTLTLSKLHRPIPAKEYLEKKYSEYVKMYENSNLLSKKIIDSLNPLPEPRLNLIKGLSSKYAITSMSDEEESSSTYNIPQIPSGFDEESLQCLVPQKIQEMPEKTSSGSLSLLSSLMSKKTPPLEKVSLLSKNEQEQKSQEIMDKMLHSYISQKIQQIDRTSGVEGAIEQLTKEPAAIVNKVQEIVLDKKIDAPYEKAQNFISQKIDRESLLPLNETDQETKSFSQVIEIPSLSTIDFEKEKTVATP